MTPQEVIARLNKHQSTVVFPRMFEKLRFDMVAEVEYHFEVDKKRVYVTKSEFWMSSDRAPAGHFVIEFTGEERKSMGRWLHHVIDPNAMKAKKTSGRIGFTMNKDVPLAKDADVLAIDKAYRDEI